MSNIMANRNIVEVAFSKIQDAKKTDLESHEIQLGLIDDFTKVFEKAIDNDASIGVTLINALSKAESKYKSVINEYEKAIKLGDKAIESAKDLGVDLPNTFKNKILSSKEGIKEARTLLSKINQLYSAF